MKRDLKSKILYYNWGILCLSFQCCGIQYKKVVTASGQGQIRSTIIASVHTSPSSHPSLFLHTGLHHGASEDSHPFVPFVQRRALAEWAKERYLVEFEVGLKHYVQGNDHRDVYASVVWTKESHVFGVEVSGPVLLDDGQMRYA